MATSGSSNFSQNCNQVCLLAFQKIGKYGIGRTVSNDDMQLARTNLNMMIKTWAADGLHLWAKEEGVLYFSQYIAKYSLGDASTDAMVTLKSDEVITRLNGALAASSTTLVVNSTVGMTVNDKIGIVLSDNTLYWTTIASITNNTTLVITTGLSGAASTSAFIYTFTSRIYKPLRILGARVVNGSPLGLASNYSEVPMSPLSYKTYMEMPSKVSNGTSIAYMFNPKISQSDIYLWPRPDNCNYRMEFSYARTIQDLDSATDDFDFPQEWMESLVYMLALRLAFDFGMDIKLKTLAPIAETLYQQLLNWDCEVDSISIYPEHG